MFQQLKHLVSQQVELTSREWSRFEDAFTHRQVPKNFKLVREGGIAKELYFINKGVVRLYYNKDGVDITGFIFTEGLFCASYDSFLRQSPSVQILESIEECELLVITKSELDQLYHDLPKMNQITRKIAEQRFINAQQILSSFILDTPEERYRKLLSEHPEIIQRVPQNIIASFLGITPVSLSRIRQRISKGS